MLKVFRFYNKIYYLTTIDSSYYNTKLKLGQKSATFLPDKFPISKFSQTYISET